MAKPRWRKSDRPFDSEHIDFGPCGGRVIVKTKSAAKRAAAASCKRLISS